MLCSALLSSVRIISSLSISISVSPLDAVVSKTLLRHGHVPSTTVHTAVQDFGPPYCSGDIEKTIPIGGDLYE